MKYLVEWIISDRSIQEKNKIISNIIKSMCKRSHLLDLNTSWCDVISGKLWAIVDTNCYAHLCLYIGNQKSYIDVHVKPICDDNTTRNIVLQKNSEYDFKYELDQKPKLNETLYFIEFKFYTNKIKEGYNSISKLSQENDRGKCKLLGRWHDLGSSSGIALAICSKTEDLFRWANNWNSLCECKATPVSFYTSLGTFA